MKTLTGIADRDYLVGRPQKPVLFLSITTRLWKKEKVGCYGMRPEKESLFQTVNFSTIRCLHTDTVKG